MENQKSAAAGTTPRPGVNESFGHTMGLTPNGKRPFSETIKRPLSEVSALLRNVENFPNFLEHLEKVEFRGGSGAQWYFRDTSTLQTSAPIHMGVEYSADNNGLVWKAQDAMGFSYTLAISLEAAQAGRGTVVRMSATYDTSAGAFVGFFEKLFGSDAQILTKKNIQRFKAYCETGHVPTIEGQSSGREETPASTMKH